MLVSPGVSVLGFALGGGKVSWRSQEDGMVFGPFAPVIEPILGTGVAALAAAARTWLPRPG